MDTEFVNVYIEKQRNAIADLSSKIILLEAHLEFANKKVSVLEGELAKLKPAEKKEKVTNGESDANKAS